MHITFEPKKGTQDILLIKSCMQQDTFLFTERKRAPITRNEEEVTKTTISMTETEPTDVQQNPAIAGSRHTWCAYRTSKANIRIQSFILIEKLLHTSYILLHKEVCLGSRRFIQRQQ